MKKTHVIFLLDRSGSMHTLVNDVVGGFDSFIADLQQEKDENLLTLIQFDDQYQVDYERRNVKDIYSLEYQPRGATALLDSLMKALALANPEEELTIIAVYTDGYENASHEVTKGAVKARVRELEERGCKFIFMGAGIDSFAEASGLGMGNGMVVNTAKNSAGVSDTYASFSSTIRGYKDEVGDQ